MTDNREAIMGHLKTTLEEITTANGYNYTVKRVYRKVRDLSGVKKLPAVLMGDATVRYEQVSPGFDRCWLTVEVVGYLKTDNPETDINYLARDIKKVVLTDSHAPHNQMSNVSRAQVMDDDPSAESGEGVCSVEFEIFYTEEV